jgi:PAS domain S-box-containing protein
MAADVRTRDELIDFLDTADIGIHSVAADGTILWANPADYEPLGYRADEYIGHRIAEFHADIQVSDDILRRLSLGERLQSEEAQLRCKNGSCRTVLITSSARFDEANNFLYTRCFTIDASRRRPEGEAERTIETLRREVERLNLLGSQDRGLIESILDASPYGIIVSDAHGKLVLQSKAAERIWAGSASASDIAGWQKYRGFHADGRPYEGGDWAMARCLLAGETVEPEEMRIQRFDDTYGTLLGGSAPIRDAAGTLLGAVAIFADVTKLKETEDELRLGAERYLTTLKSIGDAVIATDARGNINFLNPVAEQLTQWKVEDAIGKALSQVFRIVNENTRLPVESPVDKVLREGKIVGLANHTLLIGKHGREVAIDDSGAPIFDRQGNLAGVVLVFRDVTEHRREEDRRLFLNQASTLLASSLEYGPTLTSVARLAVPAVADWCAVDILERGGKLARLAVAHVNPAKVRFAQEVEARYPSDPNAPHSVQSIIRSGKPLLMEEIPESLLTNAAVDEEHLRLIQELGLKSAMVVPLRARGKTFGAITFVAAESDRRYGPRDLSFAEELATCAALAVDNASLFREAEQASHAKDEFLATISHELRTPLSNMLGWATLLQSPGMSEEKRAHGLATIERNAKAQAQLIEDLLDVSRIISGNLRLELAPVNLVTIIEAAADAIRPAALAKGVDLQVVVDTLAADATGDAARLQQVLWNLLSNGVKFTPAGGTVTVRLARHESQIELQVVDTGIGIEAEFLPHVFERFKQANASATRIQGGLGLGLAIVRHLVELHGGTVRAESDGVRKGSAFKVRLPVAAIKRAPAPAADVARAGAQSEGAPSLDGLRVLVVDDEDDARALLAEVLRRRGAEVVTAASAEHALQVLTVGPPDVLVSDISMPGEDGYSLIRKVRALTKDQRFIPAVAVTAYARREDRTRAMLAGFQAHIAKPLDPGELLIVVASLAGRLG